jgi:ribokinase
VGRLPQLGETLSSSELTTASGGKGANQAGACGRLGAHSTFLAQTGKDEAGSKIIYELKNTCNVNTDPVRKLPNTPTGQAYIFHFQMGKIQSSLLEEQMRSGLKIFPLSNPHSGIQSRNLTHCCYREKFL